MGQFCMSFEPSLLIPCRILVFEIGRDVVTLTATSNLRDCPKHGLEQVIIFKNVSCSQFEQDCSQYKKKSLAMSHKNTYVLVWYLLWGWHLLGNAHVFCKVFWATLDAWKGSCQVELWRKFTIGGVRSNALTELSMSSKGAYLHSLAPAFI